MTLLLKFRFLFWFFMAAVDVAFASMVVRASERMQSLQGDAKRSSLQRRASSSESWSSEASTSNPSVDHWKPTRPSIGAAAARARTQPRPMIPAFQEDSLFPLTWGPYEMNPEKFQLVQYPLNHHFLQHFYAPDGTVPSPFGEWDPNTGFKLQVRPIRFRPEPELLEETRRAIWAPLTANQISAQRVDPNKKLFLDGMYLWPPLELTSNGIEFPQAVLQSRAAAVPRNRYASDPTPALFQMKVMTSQGERNILMTPVSSRKWTDWKHESETSNLWAFFEGRRFPEDLQYFEGKEIKQPFVGKKMLSLMGVMYLPKSASQILFQAGVIKHLTLHGR